MWLWSSVAARQAPAGAREIPRHVVTHEISWAPTTLDRLPGDLVKAAPGLLQSRRSGDEMQDPVRLGPASHPRAWSDALIIILNFCGLRGGASDGHTAQRIKGVAAPLVHDTRSNSAAIPELR